MKYEVRIFVVDCILYIISHIIHHTLLNSLPKRLAPNAYIEGILAHDRVVLSKAITLIESTLQSDFVLAREVLQGILPHTKTATSIRIGITGVPGVGKSTFIDVFGTFIMDKCNKKLAVLAIDPTSQRTKGSIMGDKTRMESLSMNKNAYIRPSATGNALGGVARRTRETILLCEAAGFEVIIVETVGVGQSETLVKDMVDFFLLLMLAGAGDELQGIKKGIMEMADAVTITKADGDNLLAADLAKVEYQNALHWLRADDSGWFPQVSLCSALKNEGIKDVWKMIEKYQKITQKNGFFDKNRQLQQISWMHQTIKQILEEQFYQNEIIKKLLPNIEKDILDNKIAPTSAAIQLIDFYKHK